MDLVLQILKEVQPVLLVVVGAALGLLSPWVTERVNLRRRKKQIKYDLIDRIYQFYSNQKLNIKSADYLNLFVAKLDVISMMIAECADEAQLKHLKELRDLNIGFAKDNEILNTQTYLTLLNIEASIFALLSEIGDHYSVGKSSSTRHLIGPKIKALNVPKEEMYSEYRKMRIEALDEIGGQISGQLTTKFLRIDKECEELTIELNSILK